MNATRFVVTNESIDEFSHNSFHSATYLTLDSCYIKSYSAIDKCEKLKTLVIKYCNLKSIPKIDALLKLTDLDVSCNRISTIDTVSLPNLKTFNASFNIIESSLGVTSMSNLRVLDLSYCNLTSCDEIASLNELRQLIISNNKLTRIPDLPIDSKLEKINCQSNMLNNINFLSKCKHLVELNASFNEISDLDCLLVDNLEYLNVSFNKLTSIQSMPLLKNLFANNNYIHQLGQYPKLVKMYVHYNRLTSIENLKYCTNIKELGCSNNMITDASPLLYLYKLYELMISNNPIIWNNQVLRFIDRLENRSEKTVYDNKQNAHDPYIQQSVCDSVRSLLTDPPPNNASYYGLSVKALELLSSYIEDPTIHFTCMITLGELFEYVWARILKSEHTDELIKIMDEQIIESENTCFSGKFNRILSVLAGFYDDIKISISDKSRISAIVLNIGNSIKPYDPDKHRYIVYKTLLEAGYSEKDIEPWIEPIDMIKN